MILFQQLLLLRVPVLDVDVSCGLSLPISMTFFFCLFPMPLYCCCAFGDTKDRGSRERQQPLFPGLASGDHREHARTVRGEGPAHGLPRRPRPTGTGNEAVLARRCCSKN